MHWKKKVSTGSVLFSFRTKCANEIKQKKFPCGIMKWSAKGGMNMREWAWLVQQMV